MKSKASAFIGFCLLLGFSGEWACLMAEQTDAGRASVAVTQVPTVSSEQISAIAGYKTVPTPRALFGYDKWRTQALFRTNVMSTPPQEKPASLSGQRLAIREDGLAVSYQVPENQLFLEVLPASNGCARLLLHGATNEVYELMSKISLGEKEWHPEQAVHGARNDQPRFVVVPIMDRTNTVFFWARDWTKVDENRNGIPDWWEWENFGDLNTDVDRDYDGDGRSIREEFLAHIDPNKIRFTKSVHSLEVNDRRFKYSFIVKQGHPFSMAVLVDSTNYAAAVWRPFEPEVEVDLGPVEGWHEVRVGLRGRATTSQQTWKWTHFRLDTTPPTLTVTYPDSRVISGKYVQIHGTSSERLSKISYDLANSEGVKADQLAMYGVQGADDISGATRVAFQCVDVALAPGTNWITLHATDSAGNVASNSLVLIRDAHSAISPPMFDLQWPHDGTRISGTSFTCRGLVSDANAVILATYAGADGITCLTRGCVEREGSFWVLDIPLHTGANPVSLVASTESGLSVTNRFTVFKSDLGLTIDPVTPADTAASGTISQPGYAVWVNGRRAKIDANGKWRADAVPQIRSHSGTTAIWQARAIPDSGRASVGNSLTSNPASPYGVDVEVNVVGKTYYFVADYYLKEHTDYLEPLMNSDGSSIISSDDEISWANSQGGKRTLKQRILRAGVASVVLTETRWPATRWPQPLPSGICRTCSESDYQWRTNAVPAPPPFDPEMPLHADVDYTTADGRKHVRLIINWHTSLATGGRAIHGSSSLFKLSFGANAIEDEDLPVQTTRPIHPQDIRMGTLGNLGSDGIIWVALPDGLP
jgi:hypothetical protein